MKNTLIFILFVFIFNLSSAQTYEGMIGSYPVFLELDTGYNNNQATAYYFYKSKLKNISLEGSFEGDVVVLQNGDNKEMFNLSVEGENVVGKWVMGDKTLPVKLKEVTHDINQYKRSRLELQREIVISYGEKELVWFTEKYSKKRLFRLGNGFTKSERKFMNPILDSLQLEFAMMGLECSWADVEAAVKLVSDEYISFEIVSSVYCGGAHPSHSSLGYTFDLTNLVQLKKLMDYKPELNYYQLLKNKYEADTGLQEECEYFGGDEFMWKYCSWFLTDKGVIITPSFPHALTPCKEGFFLTYEELEEE